MTWNEFVWFGIPAIVCFSVAGIGVFLPGREFMAKLSATVGMAILVVFIVGLWIGMGYPPMRTMGETRLWYALFLPLVGLWSARHWQYPWLIGITSLMATVFIGVNLLKPEIHSAALMPALQSYFFIPHVTSYMISYAFLGVGTIASFKQLFLMRKGHQAEEIYEFIDNTVYIGLGFLLFGLLIGAFWAKEAWGNYWSWDPKETWALITVVGYLFYIHIRRDKSLFAYAMVILPIAFAFLMIAWLGVSYLPVAKDSIHLYS